MLWNINYIFYFEIFLETITDPQPRMTDHRSKPSNVPIKSSLRKKSVVTSLQVQFGKILFQFIPLSPP